MSLLWCGKSETRYLVSYGKEFNTTDGFKFVLPNREWFAFRASGTEPLIRCYIEAKLAKQMKKLEMARRKLLVVVERIQPTLVGRAVLCPPRRLGSRNGTHGVTRPTLRDFRASGTETLIRCYIETKSAKQMKKLATACRKLLA